MATPLDFSTERSVHTGGALFPLIEQEAVTLWCRDKGYNALHFWSHRHAVLLGARDASLDGHAIGIEKLCKQGYDVAVRPFGGLAVVLDEGVLNVSLILTTPVTLDTAFSQMSMLLTEAMAIYADVKVGEVAGSYCPGRYDLAIRGQKIAGIAQRRIAGATVVSAFVNVLTIQGREQMVAQYYKECDSEPILPTKIIIGKTSSLQALADKSAGPSVSSLQDRMIEVAQCERKINLSDTVSSHYTAMAERRLRIGGRQNEWAAQRI